MFGWLVDMLFGNRMLAEQERKRAEAYGKRQDELSEAFNAVDPAAARNYKQEGRLNDLLNASSKELYMAKLALGNRNRPIAESRILVKLAQQDQKDRIGEQHAEPDYWVGDEGVFPVVAWAKVSKDNPKDLRILSTNECRPYSLSHTIPASNEWYDYKPVYFDGEKLYIGAALSTEEAVASFVYGYDKGW